MKIEKGCDVIFLKTLVFFAQKKRPRNQNQPTTLALTHGYQTCPVALAKSIFKTFQHFLSSPHPVLPEHAP